MKTLTTHLNDHGITMRGRPWRMQKVDDVLCDRVYIGEFYFNRNEARTTKIKPPAEWIKVEVPAIIDKQTFDRAAVMRHARHPSRTPGQRLASPALLVGLMKCGHCGACMTQATGKSGRYGMYKCTTRLGIGAHRCNARNLSREPTEQAVLTALADRVFTARRVETMLRELRKRQGAARPAEDTRLQQLKRELKEIDAGIARLYEAVEKGLLPLDTTLQERSQKLQARRQDILVAMASLREKWEMPLSTLTPAHVERFARALRPACSIQPPGSARPISTCWSMRSGSTATSCASKAPTMPWHALFPCRRRGSWTRCPASYLCGTPETNRTSDLPLRRGLLYPLSYRGPGRILAHAAPES